MARYTIFCILTMLALAANAQPCGGLRYQQRVFSQSFKSSNIVYGNAPSLPTTLYLGESITQNVDLTMDVFEPFGDTLQKRPLVILSFGGAFLIGSKEDADIQSVSDSLARRGYVAACINYRLGMNVADAVSCERAIYRALQDFSAAVRYFKEYADLYRIDTNHIYVGGVSAGGFAALHMALVDESDRPSSSYGAGGLAPRPDLGCKDCSGNNYAHSSNVRGIINYWGAIGNVNWIKPGKAKPLVSFHGDQDLIVPYNTGFPFTALATLPQVSGSGAIKQRYDQIGAYNEHYVFPGEGHNIWGLMVMNQFTPGPNQYFQPIYEGTAKFLFGQSRPGKPVIQGEDSTCQKVLLQYAVVPQPGVRYCWQIDGGQIISQTGHQVEVVWHGAGANSLYATSINQLDAVSETDTFGVWVHEPVQADIYMPAGDTVCAGGGVPLLSGSHAVQYQWSPAHLYNNAQADSTVCTPLISGLCYVETIDSNGCGSRDSILVRVLPKPPIPVVAQQGDSLFAYTGGGTINWYDADSTYLFSSEGFVPMEDGVYYASEVSASGCESWSAAYPYIKVETGVYENAGHWVRVYPNPFNDRIIVQSSLGGTLTVYDATGALVKRSRLAVGKTEMLLENAHAGIYFYSIATSMGIMRDRLVKL